MTGIKNEFYKPQVPKIPDFPTSKEENWLQTGKQEEPKSLESAAATRHRNVDFIWSVLLSEKNLPKSQTWYIY